MEVSLRLKNRRKKIFLGQNLLTFTHKKKEGSVNFTYDGSIEIMYDGEKFCISLAELVAKVLQNY